MSKILKLLDITPNDGEIFSKEDIKWVEGILKIDNGFDDEQLSVIQFIDDVDVEACPGSGKTTVLIAKLALLAKYWKSKTHGICVLSMTNAAREEIQSRLANTDVGLKLLSPPHFIGTIHSFFSDFLAKPFLNSKGMRIVSIDDNHSRKKRCEILHKKQYLELTDHLISIQKNKRLDDLSHNESTKSYSEAREWLDEHETKNYSEKIFGLPIYWKMIDEDCNVKSIVRDREKELDLPDELELLVKKCVKEVVDKGFFCFSDIFVYSQALMRTSPEVFEIMRSRFPLLFIDEAQDTSKSQGMLIYELFHSRNDCGLCDSVIQQRFGDVNQTIYSFEENNESEGVQLFPNPNINILTLKKSYRFDSTIANISSNFEVNPLKIPIEGSRVDQFNGRRHCIILFDYSTQKSVLPYFSELVAHELDNDELDSAIIKACSHVHKDKKDKATDEDFARTIKDYYSPYVSEAMSKDYQHHQFLIDYFRHGRYLMQQSKSVYLGMEKFTEGVLRFLSILSEMENVAIDEHKLSKVIGLSKDKHRLFCRELDGGISNIYVQKLVNFLIMDSILDVNDWNSLSDVIMDVMSVFILNDNGFASDHRFLKWNEKESNLFQTNIVEQGNVYKHTLKTSGKGIDVLLGTIHSVKGQTHTATLIIDSTHRGPILGQLKPYILGLEKASAVVGPKIRWINTLYVGITRPTHLVCLAVPKSHKLSKTKVINWDDEDFELLREQGWSITEVTDDLSIRFL